LTGWAGINELGQKRLEFHSAEKIGRRSAGNNELSAFSASACNSTTYIPHSKYCGTPRRSKGGNKREQTTRAMRNLAAYAVVDALEGKSR
jgi:hypothetical protein